MRVLKGVLEGALTHAGTPLCSPWRAWKPSIAASAPSAFDGVTPIFDSSERGGGPGRPRRCPFRAFTSECAARCVRMGGWSWREGVVVS